MGLVVSCYFPAECVVDLFNCFNCLVFGVGGLVVLV